MAATPEPRPTVSSRHETRCVAPGCRAPVARNRQGRPASYCSPGCRSAAYRARRRDPISVEATPGSTSARGRSDGRVGWFGCDAVRAG